MPTVAVFCGSKLGRAAEQNCALLAKLGKELAQAGYGVATGGGPGMMEVVSTAAHEAGGKVIAVPLKIESRTPYPFADEVYQFEKLVPRQRKLIELADAFIVGPGGLGTFYEVFAVLADKFVKQLPDDVPLIFLGNHGVDHMAKLFDILIEEGFILREKLDTQYQVAQTVDEALQIINDYFHTNSPPTPFQPDR